jgi:hypothetical protein
LLLNKSAIVFLCFGFAAAFCFGSGITRPPGTMPTRSRAFCFTAFTMENTRFFDLDFAIALLLNARAQHAALRL